MNEDLVCLICRNSKRCCTCKHSYLYSYHIPKRKCSEYNSPSSKRILANTHPILTKDILNITRANFYFTSLIFSNDASFIIVACSDNLLRSWSIRKKDRMKISQKFESEISCLGISKNDRYIAAGCEYRIYVLNISLQILFYLVGHSSYLNSLTFSTDSSYIFSSSFDKTVRVWSFNRRITVNCFVGHTKKVESIAVTSNSEYIATGSVDKTVRLWNLNRNSLEAVLDDAKYEIYSVGFSHDDKYLIVGSNTVRVYEVKTKRLIFKLERDSSYRIEYIFTVRMSRDNQYIFFKSYYDNIYICKLNSIHNSIKVLTNSGNLYCMDLSSDDSLIAYARYDNCRSYLKVSQLELS